jgi:predicted nucleotidyltransferase
MQDERLRAVLAHQRYPLLFATLGGSYLYGFPSPDSDYDLRGAHILPLREVIGLREPKDTIKHTAIYEGTEVDLVTYDIYKFFKLLLGKNGSALEAVYSPLVIHAAPEHEELKALVKGCLTRYYAYHYLGFANNQIKQARKQELLQVKSVLSIYRALLTGLHLLRTGEIETNLWRLNDIFRLPYIPELIARKQAASEKAELEDKATDLHMAEWRRLLSELEHSVESSVLPTAPSARAIENLNDLLIRLRLQTV